MKNTKFICYSTLFMLLFLSTMIISCNKKFDEPPSSTTGNLIDTTLEKKLVSIKALRAKHKSGGFELITDDIVIKAVVVGDDRTGNIYKAMYIQDSLNWGIAVKMDGNSLYIDYPVGRQIYIKCKGLFISDYNATVQLGVIDNSVPYNPTLAGIPSPLFDNYIQKGGIGNKVNVRELTIAQLNSYASSAGAGTLNNDSLQSTVVKINDVQFSNSDKGLLYSDTTAGKSSVSRNIVDCPGTTTKTVVYTSGYATFAGAKTPRGKGSITAIYIPYRSTPELVLRDTADIKFTGLRCDGTSGEPPTNITSIAAIRALYDGSTSGVILPSTLITGVVISDASNGNTASGNLILQDGTGGVDLYFGPVPILLNVGDSVTIDVTGGKLLPYKGAAEISLSSGAIASATLIASGKVVTPKILTTAEFNTLMSAPLVSNKTEGTLVTILNATVPTGIFQGNKVLTDASGTTTLYTATAASFSQTALPTIAKSYTGYGTNFNTTAELVLRNIKDVK